MRIFFIGSVKFSRKMLEAVLSLKKAEVVGIATKSGSSFNADHDDLSDIAKANNIPYKYVKDINAPHIIDWISDQSADVIYCLGWSSLIKSTLLNVTRLGVVGYHPTELPKNRGRHPLIWSLVLGLEKTASTFFFMDDGADTGDIISQEIVEISLSDDANDLYKKLEKKAILQIQDITKKLVENEGILARREQKHIKSNYWRKRGKEDGKIDFRMSSLSIYNLIRGLTRPYVGAHIECKEEDVKVWESKIVDFEESNHEPGKVIQVSNNEIMVKTYDGAIILTKHEFKSLPIEGDYF